MAKPPPLPPPRWPRLPLAGFLPLALAGLTAVPLLAVFLVAFGVGLYSTGSLLDDKARLVVDRLVERTEQHLAPAEAAPRFIGDAVDRGALDPDDPDAMLAAIRYGFIAAPQVSGLAYVHRDGWSVIARRAPQPGAVITERGHWHDDPIIRSAVAEGERQAAPAYWGSPLYVTNAGTTMLIFVRLIRRDGAFLGGVAATMRLETLSAFVAQLSPELRDRSFILAGRDHVIAHRALAGGNLAVSPQEPLPRIGDIGDPVLAAMWQPGPSPGNDPWEPVADTALGRDVAVDGRTYYVVYRRLPMATAGEPWLVGGYLTEREAVSEIYRLLRAAAASLVALVLALIAAYALGRALRRPVSELGRLARAVGGLQVDDLATVRRSRFVELDDALDALGRAAAALRLFARYVPRRVVELALRHGEAEALRSRERLAIVMFTDMAGFSRVAARLDAEACAAFLNAHLTLLAAAIEAEGGVIDKFMGDAVMAFWPVHPEAADPATSAEAALRAALAIRRAIHADNATREAPIRVRVGLHCGRVILGSIGTAARLNFTIVGDPVNVAQRVEALAKRLVPDAEVAILLSGDVARLLPSRAGLRSLGAHHLPGREAPIEILAADSEVVPLAPAEAVAPGAGA